MRTFKEILEAKLHPNGEFPASPDCLGTGFFQEMDQRNYEKAFAQLKTEHPTWDEHMLEVCASMVAFIGFDTFEFEVDDDEEPRFQTIKTYYDYGS
jgi:hypothetical protein